MPQEGLVIVTIDSGVTLEYFTQHYHDPKEVILEHFVLLLKNEKELIDKVKRETHCSNILFHVYLGEGGKQHNVIFQICKAPIPYPGLPNHSLLRSLEVDFLSGFRKDIPGLIDHYNKGILAGST